MKMLLSSFQEKFKVENMNVDEEGEGKPHTRNNNNKRQRKKMVAFSLYCGAGGLATGLEQTGDIEVRWAVDSDRNSVDTFRAAHPRARTFCADAAELLEMMKQGWREGQYLSTWPKPGEVDLFEGCPNCQGLSVMNSYRGVSDPRNWYLLIFAKSC